ncbi:MAG: ATP-dependent 6-phosphofructokinase, partial [Deltaproteobacteria bacterium]|nr:ATP-dependent 6-phosphofructokinase [Deltaproteobacteria bacterium]
MAKKNLLSKPVLEVESLGPTKIKSPLLSSLIDGQENDETIAWDAFTDDSQRIVMEATLDTFQHYKAEGQEPPSFEQAGARRHIYFDPSKVRAGILTAGGLCPGLNDVIRSLVLTLYYRYRVRNILGIKYGYQ